MAEPWAFILEQNSNGSLTIASREGRAIHVLVPGSSWRSPEGARFALSSQGRFEMHGPPEPKKCHFCRTVMNPGSPQVRLVNGGTIASACLPGCPAVLAFDALSCEARKRWRAPK